MDSAQIEDRIKKLREERLAREKARIEKLKEINLKKYANSEIKVQLPPKALSSSKISSHSQVLRPSLSHVKPNFKKPDLTNDAKKRNPSTTMRDIPPDVISKPKTPTKDGRPKSKLPAIRQNSSKVNRPAKSAVASAKSVKSNKDEKPKTPNLNSKLSQKPVAPRYLMPKKSVSVDNGDKKESNEKTSVTNNKSIDERVLAEKSRTDVRKSFCFGSTFKAPAPPKPELKKGKSSTLTSPKSFVKLTKKSESTSGVATTSKQNVFERLYKPKMVTKQPEDEAQKLKTDPEYLKKVMSDASLLTKRRYTVFEPLKNEAPARVRRSISAVHFKKIKKDELNNCIHQWSSIGEKLDEVHLKDINEDEAVNQDRVISAVKSERKKVKFQTPRNFNTPNPGELQEKLQKWLLKRGKSLDSFHHLQCFGLHHLTYRIKPIDFEKNKLDDENKENIPLESDSDNESYHNLMNGDDDDYKSNKKRNDLTCSSSGRSGNNLNNSESEETSADSAKNTWRRASYVSDSIDLNESNLTQDLTLTSTETPAKNISILVTGALVDLTAMIKEGYDRDQCASWLRGIRERFPSAPDTSQYWECRAALEESRGDLPSSIQCWEEAIVKGTQQSVAEANLDQLLNKFMQLRISPNSGKRQVDPKMVDVKNIFKSTIIRFAVQKAKLHQSTSSPKFICTPVRRSARLSTFQVRTPLQLCSSVKQAEELVDVKFVRNEQLAASP